MSKYLTPSDLEELLELIDTFELQDIYKVIGEDNFFDILSIINKLDDIDDRIVMFGALDKLLNTNKNGLVEFDEVFLTRKKTTRDEKSELLDLMLSEKTKDCLYNFIESNPHLDDLDNVKIAFNLVNLANLFDLSSGNSMKSVYKEDEEIIEYLQEVDIDIEEFIEELEDTEYSILETLETPLDVIKFILG
ncbi:hypothetical protein TwortDSMZ_066 [Staphylococcus phage Twort]|uniref:ORF066 n=2 Tax=Staphylococcus phage Twort (strain DSM 17442 / HER 48) TaxID=2908167 RepID=Q4Z8Z3_BPTWO|nr:ORF066 [Staphylococcus phage Twort]AAX92361.1 ORF066 [Staphylococcus phage Twort]QIW89071.1 hypothetical protein TwortDSMZ_066 [Staphylococcus phage Twort]